MLENKYGDSVKKTTFLLMLLTVLAKMIGFSREIVISYFYGASGISDAYLIALTIPGSVFSIIGIGISTGYIPMYSRIEAEKDTKTADRFTNNFINCILIATAVLVLIIIIFAGGFVKLFASGFSREVFALAVSFTRISAWGILFTGIVYVYSGYLNVKRNFITPVLMSLPFNLCIILFIILSSNGNRMILPVGSALAEAFQFLLLLPFVYRKGFRHQLILNGRDLYLRQITILSLPVMAGVFVNQINVLVDKTIASRITVGGISSLSYANRLNSIIQGIFIVSVSTVIYPMISKMFANSELSRYKEILAGTIISIFIFVLPASVGLMIFAKPVVNVFFGRGAFDSGAAAMTSSALFFYSAGMLGSGMREVLSKAFYSMQDTKTPMINSILGMLLNILLSLIFSRFLGIGGLALAASTVAVFTSILLMISLHRKIGSFGLLRITVSFLKILTASGIMGFLADKAYHFLLPAGQITALLCAVSTGALSYFMLIYLMKLEDAIQLSDYLKKKIGSSEPMLLLKQKWVKWKTKGTAIPVEDNDILMEDSYMVLNPRLKDVKYVGIVVVACNNADVLEQTLKNILDQTYLYYKIFIIDNGSTDDTEVIIQAMISRMKRQLNLHIFNKKHSISYYKLNTNTGRAGGFYYGMKLAYESGVSYLWGLEGDAIPHRNALSVLVSTINAMDSKTCLVSRKADSFDKNYLWRLQNSENLINELPCFTFTGLFIPSDFICDIGYPRKELFYSFDDIDYSRRAVKAGYQIYQIRDSVFRQRSPISDFHNMLHPGKSILRQKLPDWFWYYYMRNGLLVYSGKDKEDKAFRSSHRKVFLHILLADQDCLAAALSGLFDGIRDVTGRSEKWKP